LSFREADREAKKHLISMQISVYIESAGGVAPNFPGSFLRVRQHSKNLPISAAQIML
jgi:hypothetical protein